MTDPLLFCVAVLTILATPGPTNSLLAVSGASLGFRRSLRLVPAELAGYLTTIVIVGVVLGRVADRALTLGLRVACVVVLVIIGARLWRHSQDGGEAPAYVGPRDVVVATLLNPKALVFALAVVPIQSKAWLLYLAGFSAILVPVSLTWIAIGAWGLAPIMGRALILRIAAMLVWVFAGVVGWTLLSAGLR